MNGREKGVTWHKITEIKKRNRKLGERCGVYMAKNQHHPVCQHDPLETNTKKSGQYGLTNGTNTTLAGVIRMNESPSNCHIFHIQQPPVSSLEIWTCKTLGYRGSVIWDCILADQIDLHFFL